MNRFILITLTSILLSGCFQLSHTPSEESASDNPIKTTERKKVFKDVVRITHDFTARSKVVIPKDEVLNNPKISHVILSNQKGTYKMIIDKKDLENKNEFMVPLSVSGEKIIPQYVKAETKE